MLQSQVSPHSPSMILFTLHILRVMIRLMASHGLLGPLATVEATIGAKDKIMIAPSNTWREISFSNLSLKSYPCHSSVKSGRSLSLSKRNAIMYLFERDMRGGQATERLHPFGVAQQNSSVLFMRWGEINCGGREGGEKGIWKYWPKSPRRSDSLNVITAKEFYHHWYLLPVIWHNVILKKKSKKTSSPCP